MDTEKCRVLLTVLHERSLSAAAEALGYTPSGISRLVDSLERETGFPLLHRGRGGVSATRACQELLPLMRRMAELDEQYQQLAHRIQGLDVGRVVAGTNYAAFYPWLSEVIAGFHHAYPGIRVELREGSSTQLGELVDHRRADFCLISQRPGRHEWVPLKDDREGFAIIPENETVYAPADATVSLLMQESRHACGLKLANGAQILLHIGIDTVAMKGDGFEYLVKEGQKVSAGTPLIKFDKKKISEAGYVDTIICVITEPGNMENIIFVTGIHAIEKETTVAKIE